MFLMMILPVLTVSIRHGPRLCGLDVAAAVFQFHGSGSRTREMGMSGSRFRTSATYATVLGIGKQIL